MFSGGFSQEAVPCMPSVRLLSDHSVSSTEQKKPVPAILLGQADSDHTCGATRLDACAPSHCVLHTRTFDDGGSSPSHILGHAFLLALRSPFPFRFLPPSTARRLSVKDTRKSTHSSSTVYRIVSHSSGLCNSFFHPDCFYAVFSIPLFSQRFQGCPDEPDK